MDKVFKVLNYLIMVVAGALLLYMIYLVIAAAIATSGTDDITRGGVTFFTMFACLPAAALAVIAFLAGRAGLQSDPYSCRKYAKWLLIVAIVSVVLDLPSSGITARGIITIAFYGFYTYLAHTVSY